MSVDEVFEPARLLHAEAIAHMRAETGADLREKLGDHRNWGGSQRIESIRDRIRQADIAKLRGTTLYVSTIDGQAVASVALTTFLPWFLKSKAFAQPRAKALGVFGLMVFPAYQRQGLGRFVMNGVEGLARERGIAYVRLDAYADNPFSNAFYRSIGYDEVGKVDLRGNDLILYERDVSTAI